MASYHRFLIFTALILLLATVIDSQERHSRIPFYSHNISPANVSNAPLVARDDVCDPGYYACSDSEGGCCPDGDSCIINTFECSGSSYDYGSSTNNYGSSTSAAMKISAPSIAIVLMTIVLAMLNMM